MSDDIVTRLRQEWEYGNNAKGCDYEMFSQAADEIERLREQVALWKDLASEYYHLDPKCECHLCERFRKAMDDGDR